MAAALLLVDDSELVRYVTATTVREAFGDRPFEITEVENGKEALDAVATKSFDLIILDLTMPVMDGYAFLEAMRAAGNTTKVIVMSADMQGGAIQRVRDLGAYRFLPKPVLAPMLIKALKSAGIL